MNLAGLTPNQERYLLAESSAADSFFITVWYPCDQAPDLERLQDALWAVIAEAAALRTGFARDPTHGYRSVVGAQVQPPLRRLDVDALDASSIAQAAAPHLAKLQDFSDPAALQHYFLARSADESFALVFCQHHAISDGRSLDIFIERVAARYSGRPASTPAQPDAIEPPVGEDACADYFRRQLHAESGFATFHRDRDAAFEIAARSLDLGPELSGALQQAAASTSPFSVLAAAFAAQVHAQTGSTDVLFSIQSSGRNLATRHAIGSLSNAIAINVQVVPEEPFRQLTQRVRDLVRAAVKHEALPYHRVQAITGAKADFALNLYPDAPPPAFDGLRLGPRRFLPMPSDYGVNLRWQRRLGEQKTIYEGEAYFDGGSIDPARIDHFLSRHRDILAAALADPDACVGDIVETSRRPPLAKALPASLPTPRLFELFRPAADQHPARPALRYDGASITYGELGERVERRAAALAQLGLSAGDRVAFIEQRSADYVVTMLALSRLGATFAVFDPAYPVARQAEQAEAFRA
ncbi:MAG: condensation domain-containing protein, partial [Phenylobacterium sp.]